MKLEVMNFVLKGYENSKHDITFVIHSKKATLIDPCNRPSVQLCHVISVEPKAEGLWQ